MTAVRARCTPTVGPPLPPLYVSQHRPALADLRPHRTRQGRPRSATAGPKEHRGGNCGAASRGGTEDFSSRGRMIAPRWRPETGLKDGVTMAADSDRSGSVQAEIPAAADHVSAYDAKPWLRQYPDNVPEHLDYPHEPIWQALERTELTYGRRDAFIFQGRAITYTQLKRQAERGLRRPAAHRCQTGRCGSPTPAQCASLPRFVLRRLAHGGGPGCYAAHLR